MKVLHCALRWWVNEIYPFTKCIAKLFKKCVEVPLNLECIDFGNTLIDDNHHLAWYLSDSFVCEQYPKDSDLTKKLKRFCQKVEH
jgi:hypothetical protein